MSTQSADVVVLGAGPGGYAAAFRAADRGLRTLLVDDGPRPGGVCLFRGCIPSKALLHVAKLLHETRQAPEWGVTFGEPRIDLDALRGWKDAVVERMTKGLGQLSQARDVPFLQGRGTFEDAHTLHVAGPGEDHRLRFEHCILATGSRPAVIPSLRLDSPRVMNSTTALQLESVPESLLVVGGGYIGLEMGSVYAALGSRVSVVEMTKTLLPGLDRDLLRVVNGAMEQQLDAIMLETKVARMAEANGGIQVTLEGAAVTEAEQTFEKVLVAVGRTPCSDGLGLETTQVELDERGFVKVDPQRCTAEPSIYAIGDVAGNPMLAHKATHEGQLAADAIAGEKVTWDPRAIPAVVFTDPEVAWCGLTENEAKAAKRKVKVARFPWSASGRAATLGRSDGVTKLVLDPETEAVLGVGIAGPGAGDMIAEGALAIEMAATAEDLALTIHPHPTLSETIMEAADVFYGLSAHLYAPKRA